MYICIFIYMSFSVYFYICKYILSHTVLLSLSLKFKLQKLATFRANRETKKFQDESKHFQEHWNTPNPKHLDSSITRYIARFRSAGNSTDRSVHQRMDLSRQRGRGYSGHRDIPASARDSDRTDVVDSTKHDPFSSTGRTSVVAIAENQGKKNRSTLRNVATSSTRARARERVPTFPRRSGFWVTSPEGWRGEAGRKKTGTRKRVLTSVSSFPLDAILTTSRWRSGWRSSGYLLRATRRVLHSHCSRCVLRSTILRYTVRYRARSDRACTPYNSTLRSTRVDRARANRTLALIALRARGTALAGEFRQRARLEKGRREGERRAGGEERRRWGERSETSCTSRATRRDALPRATLSTGRISHELEAWSFLATGSLSLRPPDDSRRYCTRQPLIFPRARYLAWRCHRHVRDVTPTASAGATCVPPPHSRHRPRPAPPSPPVASSLFVFFLPRVAWLGLRPRFRNFSHMYVHTDIMS